MRSSGVAGQATLVDSVSTSRRLDIQGLRGIAVIVVVFFHAGLPVPGGFIGVDVFFVISGFVITLMLNREWIWTGRIRFGNFYLKRFKRLIPALSLMVAVTVLLAAVILSPLGPQQTAAKTGIGAMLLFANFVIGRTTGGYFDAPADFNPLLNTWSLSVEEQFYLVFPALITLGFIMARRRAVLRLSPFVLVGSVAVVSFALTIVGSTGVTFRGVDTILGFYSPLTRAWEFAVGALLALADTKIRTIATSMLMQFAGLAGFIMLAASLWLITESTTFPGFMTLLPVTGTLLLLFAGTQRNFVSRALSTQPLVKVGDWSYSIYLWHWPFIVFAVYLWPFNKYAAITATIFSFAPALASYRWVENPFRKIHFKNRLHLISAATAIVITPILLALAVESFADRYWLPRWSLTDQAEIIEADAIYGSRVNISYLPCDESVAGITPEAEELTVCGQSNLGEDIEIALLGDSHANSLFLDLAGVEPEKNFALFTFYGSGRTPIFTDDIMSNFLQKIVSTPSIETVIISVSWSTRNVTESELSSVLEKITSAGKSVFIVDDWPHFPFDAVSCQLGLSPVIPIKRCNQNYADFEKVYNKYFSVLASASRSFPKVSILKSAKFFCDSETCDMTKNGTLLYSDGNHPNSVGSKFVISSLIDDNPGFRTMIQSD